MQRTIASPDIFVEIMKSENMNNQIVNCVLTTRQAKPHMELHIANITVVNFIRVVLMIIFIGSSITSWISWNQNS